MQHDSNLDFIRQKISELGTAIMYNNSQEVMKVPNNLINALRVDEQGQLWFTAQKPTVHLHECEQCFPARLHFYRKGVFFYIEASGKASVEDFDYAGNAVLMKMSLNSIEYSEPQQARAKSLVERYATSAYNWMLKAMAIEHRDQPVFSKMQ